MKYKLIKEYPGSPKLGKIIETQSYSMYPSKEIYNVIDYSEFWQPIVEKDYEILSYCIKDNVFNIKNNSEGILPRLDFKIHSVKRLSDGEIFTIGDNITSKTCSVPNKILSIEIINNELRLYPRNSYFYLKDIKKFKQPLFTTEDGVDIFESDETFYVNNNYNINYNRPFSDRSSNKRLTDQGYGKYFSTKEKAEEYILMNKPCLSLNDILSLEILESNSDIELLENLIKLKIKYNSPCKL